ncbi:hypothetical protein ACFL3G_08835 [Planctomycetota bacterium]
MKIAQIAPGVGETSTCVNCLRDAALLEEFRKLSHEVLVIPLYLPFRPQGLTPAAEVPIFFGGINVYLQQKLAFFRKTPRWLDSIFDNKKLLEWAGRKFQMVDTKLLGSTTVSMLKGSNGYQVKELDRLVSWLEKKENFPDVICLSNALLAGLAKALKEVLAVPVVCLLQGEDKFLDDLTEPYSQHAWQILGDCAGEIDAFIALGEDYANAMKQRLGISADKIHVVCDNKEIASVFTKILE